MGGGGGSGGQLGSSHCFHCLIFRLLTLHTGPCLSVSLLTNVYDDNDDDVFVPPNSQPIPQEINADSVNGVDDGVLVYCNSGRSLSFCSS